MAKKTCQEIFKLIGRLLSFIGLASVEGFRHTYSCFIFMEHLVVPTQSDAEDDGRHVFEAVDPFLPL